MFADMRYIKKLADKELDDLENWIAEDTARDSFFGEDLMLKESAPEIHRSYGITVGNDDVMRERIDALGTRRFLNGHFSRS